MIAKAVPPVVVIWGNPFCWIRWMSGVWNGTLDRVLNNCLQVPIDLHVEDGLILPNLKMAPSATGPKCSFLNEEGRCSIHGFRPGICRLFPLGRNYEGEKLSYFLLTDACPAKNKSKMKVSKWLEMDGVKDYEHFLVKWHSLTKSLRQTMQNYNEEEAKRKNMLFLQMFYFTPVQQENFYDGFYERLEQFERR